MWTVYGLEVPIADEARRVLNEAKSRGVVLRLFGGVAVKHHCPSASHRELQRNYPDLDFFGTKKQGRMIRKLLVDLGYQPNQRFNALHGETRLIYDDTVNGRSVDVFLETFKMCHNLPIGKRLTLDEFTISITDLLLTKLQIVETNEKDIRDLTAILRDHEVGNTVTPSEREVIDAGYIASLCSNDWGLQKTITVTLKKIPTYLSRYGLDPASQQLVEARIEKLLGEIDKAPKSLKWRLRESIGERKRWYELPEVPIRTS
jgi:hypothetical protein